MTQRLADRAGPRPDRRGTRQGACHAGRAGQKPRAGGFLPHAVQPERVYLCRLKSRDRPHIMHRSTVRAGSFWRAPAAASAWWRSARCWSRRGCSAAPAEINPLAPKPPHFPAKAKHVIYLFMHGGPSHIDTFDPKPLLEKLNGQQLPESLRNVRLQFTDAAEAPLLASQRKFAKHGQSGIEVSDLFPNVARYVDDMAVIRSCHHEAFVHGMALNLMNTGSSRMGFPSMGSWIVYGLGSESQNLPAYMVMLEGGTKAGPPVYGSGLPSRDVSGHGHAR